jgi:hypothetical protein
MKAGTSPKICGSSFGERAMLSSDRRATGKWMPAAINRAGATARV